MLGVRCMIASTLTRNGIFERNRSGQQFLRALRQTLGPAELLHLETVNLDRQFGRAIEPRQVDELPALQLGPVTEVRIFRERIVLPAARVVDHLAPQYSGGAVEIEEVTGARSGAVLQDEVPVEKKALHFRQEVEVAIQIAPARLHHADVRVRRNGESCASGNRWAE